MAGDAQGRLDDLESRFAFQEETIRQLNDALVAQQARIDELETTVRQVMEQIRRGEGDEPPAHQPPPHY